MGTGAIGVRTKNWVGLLHDGCGSMTGSHGPNGELATWRDEPPAASLSAASESMRAPFALQFCGLPPVPLPICHRAHKSLPPKPPPGM